MDKKEDLEPLGYLFDGPTAHDIFLFRQQARTLKKFANKRSLLVSGRRTNFDNFNLEKEINKDGGVMGADALIWLCGMKKALLLAMDEPEIIERLLQIISEWNVKRIQVYFEEGIDLLIRRAWYESTDHWGNTSLY